MNLARVWCGGGLAWLGGARVLAGCKVSKGAKGGRVHSRPPAQSHPTPPTHHQAHFPHAHACPAAHRFPSRSRVISSFIWRSFRGSVAWTLRLASELQGWAGHSVWASDSRCAGAGCPSAPRRQGPCTAALPAWALLPPQWLPLQHAAQLTFRRRGWTSRSRAARA